MISLSILRAGSHSQYSLRAQTPPCQSDHNRVEIYHAPIQRHQLKKNDSVTNTRQNRTLKWDNTFSHDSTHQIMQQTPQVQCTRALTKSQLPANNLGIIVVPASGTDRCPEVVSAVLHPTLRDTITSNQLHTAIHKTLCENGKQHS